MKLRLSIIGAVAILCGPFYIGALAPHEVTFNQFMLKDLGVADSIRHAKTVYSRGLDVLRQRPAQQTEKFPRFREALEMFDYIYSHVPSQAYVYPTEGFYYFLTKIRGTPISGNIRIADLRKNQISFAYFTVAPRKERKTVIRTITEKDGLRVKKVDKFHYQVTYKGKKTDFYMQAGAGPKSKLRSDEEFVGQIFDESGVRFDLVFNNTTDSFYNLLSDFSNNEPELDYVESGIYRSPRTSFLYWGASADSRKMLVGVHVVHVEANDFFDGPGDQVPYWLDLKFQISKAYPNAIKGNGIDKHGVYVGTPRWQRIAISPYIRYSEIEHVAKRIESCESKWDRLDPKQMTYFATCISKEFWNNPAYRAHNVRQLEKEGKNIDKIRVCQFPISKEAKQKKDMSKRWPCVRSLGRTEHREMRNRSLDRAKQFKSQYESIRKARKTLRSHQATNS